ncbi:MAG: tRNA (adenosine(37)-N6)-threonylcarbamoyltransferase complex ATPase subunit type 1 TsaE [Chloroflexota bacterium]
MSYSPEETQKIGKRLGGEAKAGDVFLLVGGLGSGKTCLVQGLAAGLGVEDVVSSPSFVLLKQYRGRLPLYHIDLYRVDRREEVEDLGLEDYLSGPGVMVVEWADRGWGVWPQDHLLIEMDYLAETQRRLNIKAHGSRYEVLLQNLQQTWS